MADYISRNRAIFECERFFKEDKEAQEQCMSLLSMLPSADVIPVKIGFWMPIYESELTGWNPEFAGCDPIAGWQCSLCGYDVMLNKQSNYCSQCGAKMEVWKDD